MSKILIKNGRIVTAVDDYVADLLIVDEKIDAIAREINADDAEVHDAQGLLVLPGGIDVHTHMEGPQGVAVNCDDYESGTVAAAFGGTTTIVDFAYQNKGDSGKKTLDDCAAHGDCSRQDVWPLPPQRDCGRG